MKNLVLAMSLLFLVGCGGSDSGNSNNENAIDNSKLTDEANDYGYYGKDVIFGESIAVGLWHGTANIDGENISNYVTMSDDGFTSQGFLWGVSQNGQRLSESDGEIIDIVSVLGNNCYNVNVLTDEGKRISGKMCKTEDSVSVNLSQKLF